MNQRVSAPSAPISSIDVAGQYWHPVTGGGLPVAGRLAWQVIDLPMPACLEVSTQDRALQSFRYAPDS
jgi:hypothetical protein